MYFYGSQVILMSLSDLIGSFFFATLYLPVFYNSKVTSTFEYLESRFDYKVRFLGSVLFLVKTVRIFKKWVMGEKNSACVVLRISFSQIVNMAVWIYAPVLMLEQVVGVDSVILVPIFSGICIFYTFVGIVLLFSS